MRRVLPLLAVLSLAFAPVPPCRPKPPPDDLKAMQGEWVEGVYEGAAAGRGRGHLMKVEGGNMSWAVLPAAMKLHPGRSPKAIDVEAGLAAGDAASVRGIYKLEGDRLTLCYRAGDSENDRPSAFKASPPGTHLHVFTRKKP